MSKDRDKEAVLKETLDRDQEAYWEYIREQIAVLLQVPVEDVKFNPGEDMPFDIDQYTKALKRAYDVLD